MITNQQSYLFKPSSYLIKKSYTSRSHANFPNLSQNQTNQTRTFTSTQKLETTTQVKENQEDLSVILKSSNDAQLKPFKYLSRNPQLVRLEKIQDLVFKKKLQNVCKYTKNSKINSTALPVRKGTCSIMLNQSKKKNDTFNIPDNNKKITQKSKYKMKWKTIQWLLEFRKEAINQMFKNYQQIVKFAKQKHKGLTKSDFNDLLIIAGLGNDQNLVDKLFYVFDEDQSGTVDYKELIIGLEVFKEDSIEDKIKGNYTNQNQVFFEICDADGSGSISQKELYDVLKMNIAAFHDRLKLKKTIAQIFLECDKNGDGVLDKDEILEASKTNFTLRQLLQQSINEIKQIDKLIENDLKEPFNEWVPASANFINYKEGIFYPYNDKIIEMFREIEDIKSVNEKFKTFY